MARKVSPLRSRIMRAIKGQGTSPELAFKHLLKHSKFQKFKCNPRAIFGNPDVVFLKEKVAVFIDGCFWHGCKKCYRGPHSNTAYWSGKLARNIRRDLLVKRELTKQDWRVVRFWECSIKKDPKACLSKVRKNLAKR